ncbi:hypothetical protein EYF80_056590 [Liparis tanakae]|uniref:Uncharacterized protein n=1 Tax=Liparis tanakae TaxID=230148 RepID=A0A4Z2EXA8_9TELE|nr:hypothetical protein EYF80_056590 [Liparis tanakae]
MTEERSALGRSDDQVKGQAAEKCNRGERERGRRARRAHTRLNVLVLTDETPRRQSRRTPSAWSQRQDTRQHVRQTPAYLISRP